MEILILFFVGCIGGFLFGMVGIGGNVLYIPIFSYLLMQIGFHNEELSRAVIANALLVLVFTGTAVSWQQFKVGNFFLKEILWTASMGVTTAFCISWWIQSSNWYNKKTFDVVFTALLFLTLTRLFTHKKKENTTDFNKNLTKEDPSVSKPFFTSKLPYLLVGSFTGALTAFSGLGGSIVMIPLFTEFVGLPIKKAHSISTGVVPLLALTISTFYCFGTTHLLQIPFGQIGYLNFSIVAPVIVGSMLTSPFGVQAAHKVKPVTQRSVFAIIVGVVLCKMLFNFFV